MPVKAFNCGGVFYKSQRQNFCFLSDVDPTGSFVQQELQYATGTIIFVLLGSSSFLPMFTILSEETSSRTYRTTGNLKKRFFGRSNCQSSRDFITTPHTAALRCCPGSQDGLLSSEVYFVLTTPVFVKTFDGVLFQKIPMLQKKTPCSPSFLAQTSSFRTLVGFRRFHHLLVSSLKPIAPERMMKNQNTVISRVDLQLCQLIAKRIFTGRRLNNKSRRMVHEKKKNSEDRLLLGPSSSFAMVPFVFEGTLSWRRIRPIHYGSRLEKTLGYTDRSCERNLPHQRSRLRQHCHGIRKEIWRLLEIGDWVLSD